MSSSSTINGTSIQLDADLFSGTLTSASNDSSTAWCWNNGTTVTLPYYGTYNRGTPGSANVSCP
jgi:hypothetical protein